MRNPYALNEFRSYARDDLGLQVESPYSAFEATLKQMEGQPQGVRERMMAEIRLQVLQKHTL